MKKKIISIVLILTLLLSLCSCDLFESEQHKIDVFIDSYYEELTLLLTGAEDLSQVRDYLLRWASDSEIPASYDNYNNVIMSKPATKGMHDKDSTIFQCTLSLSPYGLDNRARSIATAMYLISQSEAHGFIRILFTADSGNSEGSKNITANYLKADNLISLDSGESNTLVVGSSDFTHYKIEHKIDTAAPSYTHAYELSISGLRGDPTSDTSKHPNPIMILSNLLAAAQSATILLEIASFDSEGAPGYYPTSAKAVVLINQNDIAKFTRRVKNNMDSFKENYASVEPLAEYTFTEVPLPEHVISYDDTYDIIAFLYTVVNGTYCKNENKEIIAASTVNHISTADSQLVLDISTRSNDTAISAELAQTFDSVCALCSFEYKIINTHPIWDYNYMVAPVEKDENHQSTSPTASALEGITAREAPPLTVVDMEKNPLIKSLSEYLSRHFNTETNVKRVLDNSACAVFCERAPKLNIICFGVDENHQIRDIQVLLDFLSGVSVPESAA